MQWMRAWGTRMDLAYTALAPVLETSAIGFPTRDIHSQRVFAPAVPLQVHNTTLGGDQLCLTRIHANITGAAPTSGAVPSPNNAT